MSPCAALFAPPCRGWRGSSATAAKRYSRIPARRWRHPAWRGARRISASIPPAQNVRHAPKFGFVFKNGLGAAFGSHGVLAILRNWRKVGRVGRAQSRARARIALAESQELGAGAVDRPRPSPLPSRERGFVGRYFRLVSSRQIGRALWIPAFAGMTGVRQLSLLTLLSSLFSLAPYVLTRSFTRSRTASVSSTRSSMISAAGRAWSIIPATCPAGLKIRSWRPAFSADWLKPDISVP